MRRCVVALLAVLATVVFADTVNLIPNGEFVSDGKGFVKGWEKRANIAFHANPAGFNSIQLMKPGAGYNFKIKLDPSWGVLTLKTKMKSDNLEIGNNDWMTGRIPMSFHDSKGRQVGGWPHVFGVKGTCDWIDCERDYVIPKGAATLNIAFAHFGKSGTVSFGPTTLVVKRNRADKPCNVPVPDGITGDPWSIDDAWRQTTASRVRYSLNGLWGMRPVISNELERAAVPAANDNWGWAKIPSMMCEPTGWYGNVQKFWVSPWFEDNMRNISFADRAWYRRDFTMPTEAKGKRVVLTFTMLSTKASVFVDGNKAAEVVFPGGEADITRFVRPGEKQSIVLLVTAYPLNKETLDFNAPDRAVKTKVEVRNRGVTGDVYLDVFPQTVRIEDATCETSVKDRKITFIAETENLVDGEYKLQAVVKDLSGKEVKLFSAENVKSDSLGTLRMTKEWKDVLLWDTHTPQNMYVCELSVYRKDGKLVDAALPFKFGFRDFVINGKDLMLNGVRIHLRALHNETMNRHAANACKEAALALCRQNIKDGYNYMIAGNYNFSPGYVSYMDALLEACDETGMLFSFSLPHIRDFDFKLDDPKVAERYRNLTKWVIRRARNHPSVVTYAMNHNSTGYAGDMNPLRMDGKYIIGGRNREQAQIACRIAKSIDSTRPVYHHESGNLDDFHTVNIYLNWSPVQERSDWLEHWSKESVKPLFFVEWGMPHISSWSSYRGPLFIWRSNAYQSLWASEFAAAFRGDAAYEGDTSPVVKALSHEERLWAKGKPFHWGGLNVPIRLLTNNYYGVHAHFMKDNWRSHRAWGISAMLPWDQQAFATETSEEVANPNKLANLKQPGIVPDCMYKRTFTLTAIGETMKRWNAFDCAFIGGDNVFTDKRHLFRPSDTVNKTLVIMNDRRVPQNVEWSYSLKSSDAAVVHSAKGTVAVQPGSRVDVPVSMQLPSKAGKFTLRAAFAFAGGVKQTDEFAIESIAAFKSPQVKNLYLYDTKGLTAREFDRLGIKYTKTDLVNANAFTNNVRLVIGRESLTADIYNNVVLRLMMFEYNNILIFEQNKETLESIGMRVQNHGLRNLFHRYKMKHFEAFTEERMRDWAGESTLLPPYSQNIAEVERSSYPREKWAGFIVPRVWRCRNRGMVAGVIFEKPAAGDWRSIFDGGFDLQYTALAENVVNLCRTTFCQLDVTARTVNDPVADDMIRSLTERLNHREPWKKWVRALGQRAFMKARHYHFGMNNDPNQKCSGWYLVSSGAQKPDDFLEDIKKGGKALCLGLNAKEVKEWSPVALNVVDTNNCYYTRVEKLPPELNGLSNADWAWHGAMDFAAFTDKVPDGNNAIRVVRYGKGAIVFWQVPPWKFDTDAKPYLRTSRRRADAMFARLCSNLGIMSQVAGVRYFDTPVIEDDPYRYYRW